MSHVWKGAYAEFSAAPGPAEGDNAGIGGAGAPYYLYCTSDPSMNEPDGRMWHQVVKDEGGDDYCVYEAPEGSFDPAAAAAAVAADASTGS